MFLLTFLHVLGSLEHVVNDVNEVKDIASGMNIKMEGFDKAQGKDIELIGYRFILYII